MNKNVQKGYFLMIGNLISDSEAHSEILISFSTNLKLLLKCQLRKDRRSTKISLIALIFLSNLKLSIIF